jgi:spermidine synthase
MAGIFCAQPIVTTTWWSILTSIPLILYSSYANIRLESYIFTEQAFADVKRVLKPEGIFVMYNVLRQGWIVEMMSAMAERTFGCPPIVVACLTRKP